MRSRSDTSPTEQTAAELEHFITAQNPVFDRVLAELSAGQKRTHWMWFIFPQLLGLGHSFMAQKFGIASLEQAQRYLSHPVLGERLRHVTQLMLNHKDKTALAIFGSPDDMKFRSCLTLFCAASADPADKVLFGSALAQFYDGAEDSRTLEMLRDE